MRPHDLSSRCRGWAAVLGLCLLILASDGAGKHAGAQNARFSRRGAPVDFYEQIWPVFEQHCIGCHGPDDQRGGLRLDEKEFAARGGDSRKPILGGTLETNEIYQRIASDDPTYRMPKNADGLDSETVARFRQWVLEGTPWPDEQPGDDSIAPVSRPDPDDGWFIRTVGWLDRHVLVPYEVELRALFPFLWIVVAVHLAVLLVEIVKRIAKKDPARYSGRLFRLAGRFGIDHYLGLWLLLIACAAGTILAAQKEQVDFERSVLARDYAQLQRRLDRYERRTAHDIRELYGSPPIPPRPTHPKRLGGEYYRGNCERNPKLFNNGNYRTATFRIKLCDRERRVLAVGDAVPEGPLYVRFELERAPGATPKLFTEEIMSAVFLSADVLAPSDAAQKPEHPLVLLETVETGEKWEAYYPIGERPSSGAGQLSGIVYVYKGRPDENPPHGQMHYGIRYELTFEDGRITADSDLWMGNLFTPGPVALTPPGKLPMCEWFDYRPIPEIVGTNTDDPDLLGLPEHLGRRENKP